MTPPVLHINALPHEPNTFHQSATGTWHRTRAHALAGQYPLNPADYVVEKPTAAQLKRNPKAIGKQPNAVVTWAKRHKILLIVIVVVMTIVIYIQYKKK